MSIMDNDNGGDNFACGFFCGVAVMVVMVVFFSCTPSVHVPRVFAAVCGEHMPVVLDKIVGDPWTPVMVRDAIDHWNRLIGRDVLLHYGRALMFDTDSIPPYLAVRTAPFWEYRKWPLLSIGRHVPLFSVGPNVTICLSGGRIYLKDISHYAPYGKRARLVAHEVGHALGLVHSAERGTIMHYEITHGGSYDIGTDTMADLDKLYGEPTTEWDKLIDEAAAETDREVRE